MFTLLIIIAIAFGEEPTESDTIKTTTEVSDSESEKAEEAARLAEEQRKQEEADRLAEEQRNKKKRSSSGRTT